MSRSRTTTDSGATGTDSAPSLETARSIARLRPAHGMGEPAPTSSVRAPHADSQPEVETDPQPRFCELPLRVLYFVQSSLRVCSLVISHRVERSMP